VEYATDPMIMAEMTADTSPTPEELLIQCEEDGLQLEDYLIGEVEMSNKTQETKGEELDKDLTALNKKPEGCIGYLHMTTDLHALLQDEAERLRRSQVSNLWWIATFAGEFGETPTIEDVFNSAPAIAENVDLFIYDRQAMPDGYQDAQGRLPRSAKQYKSIEDNSRRLLDNQVAIETLKAAGYNADHLQARDLFGDLDQKARMRNVARKAAEDNATIAQRSRMTEAAKSATARYGFEL
jgi:hypothetical protein